MAEQRELSIVLKLVDKLTSGLKPIEKELANTGKKMTDLGKSMSLAITTPLTVAGALFVKTAADAAETENRFKQVFGDLAADASRFADELGEAVGRSSVHIKEGLSTFQSFAVGMGFGKDQAKSLSETLQTLSLDFASFNNVADSEAMQRFISALSGSGEVLDRFGINIKQSALDLELQAMGLAKSTMEANEQQKVLARLSIIMKAMTSQGAVGDAIRTQASFVNQLKRLNDAFYDLRVSLGKDMIPALAGFLEKINYVIDSFNNLNPNVRKGIIVFATFLATVGPFAYVIGKMVTALAVLRTALLATSAATWTMLGPWGIAIGLAAALATAIGIELYTATDRTTNVTEEMQAQINKLAPSLSNLDSQVDSLSGSFGTMGKEAEESRKKLEDLRKEAQGVIKDIAADEASSKQDIGNAVVEQEQKVADLTKEIEQKKAEQRGQIAQGASHKIIQDMGLEITALESQLQKEKEALQNYSSLRVEYAEQVAEAERRASLTAFERKIEDIQKERKARLEAHLEKLQQVMDEIAIEQKKNEAIAKSYTDSQKVIREETKKTTEVIQSEANKQYNALQMIADAKARNITISQAPAVYGPSLPGRASGGPVSAGHPYIVGERGPELFVPGSNGSIIPKSGINVNVTINGDVSGRELVDRVQEAIMSGLRMNTKLAL